jgi:peptidyl-prolyl cis-trans isomerase A (cyclophilin A)
MDNQLEDRIRIEVIQGGLLEDEKIDSHPVIEHETTEMTGIRHTDGVVSMARNEPGSASTEFFICIGDQPELDFGGSRNPDGQGFAAFGKVTGGMEVVKTIQALPDSGQMLIHPVRILNIRRVR